MKRKPNIIRFLLRTLVCVALVCVGAGAQAGSIDPSTGQIIDLLPARISEVTLESTAEGATVFANLAKTITVPRTFAELNGIVNAKWGRLSANMQDAWTGLKTLRGGGTTVDVAKGAVKVSDQIENTLARLTGKAKYSLNNTGEYRLVGGHHPVAKIAFEGDLAYDYQKAFSVKTSALDDAWKSANSGIPQNLHAKVTGQQKSLYTAWKNANPNTKLTIDVMADIEIQAMKNVEIPEDIATGWVVKALEDLKTQGVTEIKNIPWNGVN